MKRNVNVLDVLAVRVDDFDDGVCNTAVVGCIRVGGSKQAVLSNVDQACSFDEAVAVNTTTFVPLVCDGSIIGVMTHVKHVLDTKQSAGPEKGGGTPTVLSSPTQKKKPGNPNKFKKIETLSSPNHVPMSRTVASVHTKRKHVLYFQRLFLLVWKSSSERGVPTFRAGGQR